MNETPALQRADLPDDPFDLFAAWLTAARAAGVPEPTAMALATVAADGRPACRMVLMRGLDRRGLAFYTHLGSPKARALAATKQAAATFWWPALERQVRVEGCVERVPDAAADAYFRTRPRGSQLSAWASPQSDELPDRGALERRRAAVEERFADSEDVPRPPFWGGFRLLPDAWEFWQGRPDRAHDRFRFEPAAGGRTWRAGRLAP